MLGWVLRGMSLRGTCSALDWMQEMDVEWGFDFLVPHCTTVRLWLLRLGYYKLHRPKEQASDWVWIIDHSNQIGKEKCLVILGVRVSQLPPPGQEWAVENQAAAGTRLPSGFVTPFGSFACGSVVPTA
jgi:hypothetical protein